MNRPKKAAEMYEMDQGYVQAIERHEGRMYGYQKISRGRSRVKVFRWYHKLWDEVKQFFSPKDVAKDAAAKRERMHSHMKRQGISHNIAGRSFHSRRT
jgi:hypothetical protein